MTTAMSIFVIYFGTSDYGDRYVVKEQRVQAPIGEDRAWPPEGFFLDHEDAMIAKSLWPLVITPSLAAARAAIQSARPGLIRMVRDPKDDPVIVETWL